MAKNPDERFQSGEEFAQALRVAPAAAGATSAARTAPALSPAVAPIAGADAAPAAGKGVDLEL
jgi:hypothetical protein